jgi:hypothetical protein
MKIYISLIILMISFQANAYIGPGMGVGAIVSAIGVVGAILLAILGIIYYPLKRFIRNRKNK